MRNIFFIGLFCSFFWANDIKENIIKTFASQDISIKVMETQVLNHGLSIAVIEQENGIQIPIFVTNDGKNVMGTSEPLIFTNKGYEEKIRNIYKKMLQHNKKNTDEKILKNLPKQAWITFKGQGKNKVLYLIVDANCPYCKQEIKNLEEKLKHYQKISIAFVGILNENSIYRAMRVYDDYKNLKTQQEMIKLVNFAFEKNFTTTKTDAIFVKENSKITIQAGLSGVPYMIEE